MKVKEIIVFIYLPGETVAVPAGIFTYDSDAEIGTFAYGQRYIERSNAMPVDPVALPLALTPRAVTENSGLYGAFRDASPDYWGRLIIAAELKTTPEALSEIDFLLNTNAARVGNLDFRMSLDSPEPKLTPPAFEQLFNVLHAAEEIESGKPAEPHLIRLLRQGTSMGGARPKCSVEWKNELWIAKFPAKNDSVDIPTIEFATMKLAEKCGIEIPKVKLKSIAGKNIYLIKRFDRAYTSKGYIRNGFISSLSLMKLDEKDRVPWSYISIAGIMRKYCPADDLAKLFRRMVFNILVRNTDDHPRNHGFLTSQNGLKLSPAYDIVPTFTQMGVGTDFNLAMSVGEKGRLATIKNALSRCDQFGLSTQDAKKMVEELKEHTKNWKLLFEECGVSEREIQLLEASIK